MRAWWDRLIASPRALAALGAGIVAVLVVTTVLVVSGVGDDEPAAAANQPSASTDAPGDDPAREDEGRTKGETKAPLPPDKDTYCPAFQQIQKGGLTPPNGGDEDGVDLAELSRTFDGLITRYRAAARVSPLSLRDDYAQALGYLRQGKKATTSQDVALLRALVVNLESLNDSMAAIQSKSATFCG